MDRNLVIATVLIALILFGWLALLSPPPPSPTQASGDSTQVAEQPVPSDTQAAPPADPVPALRLGELQDTVSGDSTFAGVLDGTPQEVVVVSDRYEAVFSSKGGTLTAHRLKTYDKANSDQPVQLVDTTGSGALALSFTTPSNRVVDTRSFFFTPDTQVDTLNVTGEGATLSYSAQLGEGVLRLTYVFRPDTYEIGFRVEQEQGEAFATRGGYDVIWNGGVPFTEVDRESDAMYSGAYARSGGELENVNMQGDEIEGRESLGGQVDWVAVKSKYFTAVMIPDGQTRGAEIAGAATGEASGAEGYREDYVSRLLMPTPQGADTYRLYLGPIAYTEIADYDLGLYELVDFGYDAFEWMVRPIARWIFIPAFHYLGMFIPNMGLVIIVLAFLVKGALFPLTKKSFKSMAKMRDLQPKMEEIKEKHGDNPQKQQEAMMKLYKETGVNPLGGCLPMLFQWPVIIALWQFLPQSIEIRQEGFLWAQDLSAPDAILSLPFEIPFYGDFVAGFTLLMGISMVVQMRIQSGGSMSNAQAKIFTYVFPVMIFAFFNRLASGLSLYYLCYNVLTAFQQKLINYQVSSEDEDIKPAASNGRGGKGKGSRKGKKVRT